LDHDLPRQFRFDSQDHAPAHRIEAWEAASAQIGCVTSISRIEEPFRIDFTAGAMGSLLRAEFRGSTLTSQRTARDIARSSFDGLFIYQHLADRPALCRTRWLDDSASTRGDLVIGDPDGWFESRTNEGYHHRFWILPRPAIEAAEAPIGQLQQGLRLSASEPISVMLRALLDAAHEQMPRTEPGAAGKVTDAIAGLIAAAGGARPNELTVQARDQGRMAMVERLIAQRLRDPLLRPETAAAACGISLRRLHALFESTDTTFSHYVAQRRLQLVRSRLRDPSEQWRSVSEIAFASGFNSLATFYRAYRAAFGEAPGDTRAHACEVLPEA
jgi:AraC-like DNA-binding protein